VAVNWRDRFGEKATCIRCLEVRETSTVDRLFWCEQCRESAARRAAGWGRLVGAVVAGLLTVWIVLWVRPARDLILGGWVATVVALFYLASRLGREVGYGAMRLMNRRAVEAVPPAVLPEPPKPAEGEEGAA